MANRVIREGILNSDRVDQLSWPAEVFYRRLMSVVDDFGRFDARVSMLRSALYPLRVNKVSDSDVVKWLGECSTAGLVRTYQVNGKQYLEINDFGQTIRIKKSKFPAPEIICKQMQADASRCMSESRSESGVESRSESGTHTADAGADVGNPTSSTGKKKKSPPSSAPPPLVQYPFGERFLASWNGWKDYKAQEFKFRFKSPHSEQASLTELVNLAKGHEETAIAIINQSMAKGWKGFFELKTPINGSANHHQQRRNQPVTGDDLMQAHARMFGDRGYDQPVQHG
jgi:hypothetical protein